jgi:hypothetical protein
MIMHLRVNGDHALTHLRINGNHALTHLRINGNHALTHLRFSGDHALLTHPCLIAVQSLRTSFTGGCASTCWTG